MKKIFLLLITILFSFNLYAQKHTSDHYDHAIRQAFNENRWEAGKYMIDEAEPYYGNLSKFYELKGWYYYNLKDYNKARYWLSKCVNDDNFNTHAKTLLSYVEEYTQHYSSSICYINELLEGNAYDKTLWVRKINMYRKLGNQVEADKLIKRLYEIYPEDEKVKDMFEEQTQLNLKTAKSKNDIVSQLVLAKDLVKVNPSAENHLAYVNLLINAGYLNEALNACGLGIRQTNSSTLLKKKCDILFEQGKYDDALNFIAEHKGNSVLQKAKSDIEKELSYQSVRYDPYIQYQKLYEKTHDRESFNFIVNTALSRGYYYDAIDFINDYKKRTNGNTNVDLLYKEYTAYHRMGNDERAAEILDLINRISSNNPYTDELCEMYYKQANDLILNQEYKSAKEKILYIIKNSSDNTLVISAKKKLYTCYLELNELDEALNILDDNEYLKKADILAKQGKFKQALSLISANDSTAYADLSISYIKKLMNDGKYELAYEQCRDALIYTDCKEIYSYIISSGNKIGKNTYDYILAAISKYPLDDHFINLYCGMMNDEALSLRKKKKYEDALLCVEKGLEYNPNYNELLITKGMIYENMNQYELAYEYQKKYNPSVLEETNYIKRMQGLQSKMMKNQINVFYEYYRTENKDTHKSQAGIEYSRKNYKDSYSAILNYTAREDASDVYDFNIQDESGGPAIQFGGTYENFNWVKPYTLNCKLLFGTKYFPIMIAGVGVSKEFKYDWVGNIDITYKLINSFVDGHKKNVNLFDLSLSGTKNFEYVNLTGKTDLFLIDKKFYINGSVICNYFPFEKNSTKLFIGVGVGTAPEMSITNNVVPIDVNKLNTYLCAGGVYFINQHLGIGFTGSWYSLYNIKKDIVKYTDLFYLHFNTVIKF